MPGPRPASRPTPHAAGLLRRVAVSALVAGLFGNGLGIATPGIEAQVEAQIVVSSNAGNQALVNGTPTWVDPPRPDTATVIDLNVFPPRILAEIEVPGGVTGPPQAVAITPDEAIALVASSTRNDPAKPKQGTPNDVLTVIDLQARPAKVIATFHTGGRAGGVSINKAGTLALVGTRTGGVGSGGVAVYSISGKTVTPVGTVAICDDGCDPSTPVFTPDGRTALVTRYNDHKVAVLAVDGTKVTYTKQDITAGLKPYPMEMAPDGQIAVVSNVGNGLAGGTDALSVIDLTGTYPHVVNTISVPALPEGIAFSPDGRYLAAGSMNGSNSPPDSPYFNDYGILTIFRRSGAPAGRAPGTAAAKLGTEFTKVAQARIGHWCEGIAWNRAGSTLLLQCGEEELRVFRFDGRTLTPAGTLKVTGVPSGIRTAWK